ncbi:MAG: formate dehydrogenase accessory sulfurtransferase FdhD [Nitrospirota bacterium]
MPCNYNTLTNFQCNFYGKIDIIDKKAFKYFSLLIAMNPYLKRKIVRKNNASFEEMEDFVAVEKKLRVSINGKEFISLYCTPSMIKELVIGFFLTEGIIKGEFCAEKINIEYNEDIMVDIPVEGDVVTEGMVITSGCIGGITFTPKRVSGAIKDDFSVYSGTLKILFKEFHLKSEIFRLTGGVHSAALSDGREILVFAEDIGRHNAVDKVIGYSILKKIPFAGKLILVSGRLSSEIVSKCSRWSIPILASRAAPTDLAIKIAEKTGVTLVGFVRGDRLNVYTNSQRIKR